MANVTKEFVSKHEADHAANQWEKFKGDFEVRRTALSMAIALDPACGMMEDEGDRNEHADVIIGYAAAFDRYLRLGRAPN